MSYTPGWLSNPSLGHQIFTATEGNGANGQHLSLKAFNESIKRNAKPGPRRTIARRGTEVFVAVGKEIRWADLVYLKESWEQKQESQRKDQNLKRGEDAFAEDQGDHAEGYRVRASRESFKQHHSLMPMQMIRTTVADEIRQLIISPHSNYLAILTTHTVHIAILPDSSHLTTPDTSPLRLKTFTLGPVTHVTSQSPVVSALWHPLGVNGSCLVTVTEDAVVRLWELSPTDRWSFDRPTLAIDLKKLADGTSVDQDFGASVTGMNRGFSPDSFEMEVASACYGARGSGGWSPMTLWVAMREGDVYALCPLLPERWSPPPTLIPSLSVSIVAKVASTEDDPETSEQSKLLSHQQLAWMSDLDNQDPVISETPLGDPPAEIYKRPLKPGRIPKLQGPFDLELAPEDSNDELDAMLSDIYVIGSKVDADALMSGEDEDLELDEADQGGLSAGVICLLSSSGRLTVCLDLDGVEAQWLPNTKSKQRKFTDVSDPPSLLTFQVLDTLRPDEIYEENWPMFSHDISSRYSTFVTHSSSVTFISFSSWVFRLESELQGGAGVGVDFRMDLLVKGQSSIRERLLTVDDSSEDRPSCLAASSILRDPDLGYFLLTATSHGPTALIFETPDLDVDIGRSRSPTYDSEPEPQPLLLCAPRPVYQPPHVLTSNSALPSLLESLHHSKYKRLLHEPIRLSPATLTIFTDAHKILSEETHRLGTAAAEIFRRCERLQIELHEQINRANEVACRVEAVTGDDVDADDGSLGGNEGIEKRVEEARERQLELAERLERVRRKAATGNGKELSDRENLWVEEVAILKNNIFPPDDKNGDNDPMLQQGKPAKPWQRFEEVRKLNGVLALRAREIALANEGVQVTEGAQDVRVPSEVRKGKVAQVMTLLEREGALVEGAKSRLERLSLS